MTIIQNAGTGEVSLGFYGHGIDNSLRFNDDDSAYLSKTPGSGGNRTTFTLSCWVKRSNLGEQTILDAFEDDQNRTRLMIDAGNRFQLFQRLSNADHSLICSGISRDLSAWYNVIWAVDTTQSTAANRVKIYINGVQQTFTGTGFPDQNEDTFINHTVGHSIGSANDSGGRETYFDGYLAEMNLIDGSQLTPASFGETKDSIWIPKNTSGLTFGTNGFRLEFKQTGTGTASTSTIGADTSGQTNHFTSNNLAANDVVADSPTNNWCTFNPLSDDDQVANTFSQGNLGVTPPGSGGFESAVATFALPRTGKWYWEYRTGQGGGSIYGRPSIITVDEFYTQNGGDARDEVTGGSAATNPNGILFTANDGGKRINNSDTSFGSAVSAGDKIGLAYNAGTGQLFIYINNSIQASGAAINETIKGNFAGKDVFIMHERYNGGGLDMYNFGQDSSFAGAETAQGNADGNGKGDFFYAPPTDFLALCSANLPDVTIGPGQSSQADDNFNTVLWTGDNSVPRNITGVGFSPDWMWVKDRVAANNHVLVDTVRGISELLYSNSNIAAVTGASQISAVGTDGFTIGANTYMNENGSSNTYVGWNWLAATAFSNDASATSVGTIDCTGRVNTKAGLSIISYTGNGATGATVAHGLSSALEFYIIKNRDAGFSWTSYHAGKGAAHYIQLDSSGAATSTNDWNGTAPTSSVFTVSGDEGRINKNGTAYIAYCFHSVEGYSKVGSYVGNGNADGPFIHTGFRPAWILIKNITDANEEWEMWDNTRDPHNVVTQRLRASTNGADVSSTFMDFVSNGVKQRNYSGGYNASNKTYIYLAFADQPFKYSNAR